MRLAFVSDAIYPYNMGGKEKRLFEITTRLAGMGHEVHVYTMHWWDGPEKTRMEHGLHLHAISPKYEMYKGDRRTMKQAIMFALACFRMRREQFDVVDVDHMPFFPIFAMRIVCFLKRKKLYGTWHEALTYQDWTSYMGRIGVIASMIERIGIRLPYRISSASVHTTRLLASYHHRRHGVHTVPSGIHTELIATIPPADIRCDVLFAGRLVKDKNVALLVRAMSLLAKKKPDVRCTIIGHGIEKERLAQLVTELGLQKQVRLLDPLPEAGDVYAYMKAARVFCLPSNREGFGIVALEALACNTPVVTSNAPANGAKSLITDGKNGSVVETTPEAIAAALEFWIGQKKQDYASGVAEYNWDNVAKKQLEVYA